MKIITSGYGHADIDLYGGIIAYAELLNKQGVDAKAVCTAPFNESIPPTVRAWHVDLDRQYNPSPDDEFVLIDISEPDYFEKFVDLDRVVEVIDHRPGFGEFWQDKIGEGALVESVGAACTQIFEKWQQSGLLADMSQTSARLLMCGILDNTLNFGADVTTDRDGKAYVELKKIANLPEDWPAQYFRDCQSAILSDLSGALKVDTKTLHFKTFPETMAVGQLALWDAADIIERSEAVFKQAVTARGPQWFVNAISISEKQSYFVSDAPEVKIWLSDLLGVVFEGNVAKANRMWLRKEILKADIDKQNQL